MAKRDSELIRVDKNFAQILKSIPIDRIKSNLESDKISLREVTRMTTNTEAWQQMIKELRTKTRRAI